LAQPIESPASIFERLGKAICEVGGEDLLAAVRREFTAVPSEKVEIERLRAAWDGFLKDVRIRIGTLLKADNVAFLLGAGASREAGGVLLGSIPIEVERDLLGRGVTGDGVRPWVRLFYEAVRQLGGAGDGVPSSDQQIQGRFRGIATATALRSNYETVLSLLWRWRSAMPENGGADTTRQGQPSRHRF
jgi:hypothetical protein